MGQANSSREGPRWRVTRSQQQVSGQRPEMGWLQDVHPHQTYSSLSSSKNELRLFSGLLLKPISKDAAGVGTSMCSGTAVPEPRKGPPCELTRGALDVEQDAPEGGPPHGSHHQTSAWQPGSSPQVGQPTRRTCSQARCSSQAAAGAVHQNMSQSQARRLRLVQEPAGAKLMPLSRRCSHHTSLQGT